MLLRNLFINTGDVVGDSSPTQLRRVLRVRDGLAVTVGIVIGAGILGTARCDSQIRVVNQELLQEIQSIDILYPSGMAGPSRMAGPT